MGVVFICNQWYLNTNISYDSDNTMHNNLNYNYKIPVLEL